MIYFKQKGIGLFDAEYTEFRGIARNLYFRVVQRNSACSASKNKRAICSRLQYIQVNHVDFVPIEFLDWDCLTIGALGWGQIQIANSNRIVLTPHNSRKRWMIELCDTLLEFYPKEIGKIQERIEYFEKVKSRWQTRR